MTEVSNTWVFFFLSWSKGDLVREWEKGMFAESWAQRREDRKQAETQPWLASLTCRGWERRWGRDSPGQATAALQQQGKKPHGLPGRGHCCPAFGIRQWEACKPCSVEWITQCIWVDCCILPVTGACATLHGLKRYLQNIINSIIKSFLIAMCIECAEELRYSNRRKQAASIWR